jgi:hypothetical protein
MEKARLCAAGERTRMAERRRIVEFIVLIIFVLIEERCFLIYRAERGRRVEFCLLWSEVVFSFYVLVDGDTKGVVRETKRRRYITVPTGYGSYDSYHIAVRRLPAKRIPPGPW